MRFVSPLVAFMFLGAAVAGVVPAMAGRNVAVADGKGGKGGPSGSMSGVLPLPSSPPTDTSVYPAHQTSPGAMPSGGHPHRSGSPSEASGYPVPSGGNHTHTLASRTVQPTDGPSQGHHQSQMTGATQPHHSGVPSGVSGYPGGAKPSGVHGHKSGSPSGMSMQPEPTMTPA